MSEVGPDRSFPTPRLSALQIAELLELPPPTEPQQRVIEAPLSPVLVVAGAVALPLLTGVHPVAGALLGGLGAGALSAALVLGAVLLIQRRTQRRALRTEHTAEPVAITTDTPPGGG